VKSKLIKDEGSQSLAIFGKALSYIFENIEV